MRGNKSNTYSTPFLPIKPCVAPLPSTPWKRRIWRLFGVFCLSVAAVCPLCAMTISGGGWWFCLLTVGLIPIVWPAQYTIAYPRRLQICGNGAELLIIFVTSTVLMSLLLGLLALSMLPAQWVAWTVGAVGMICVEWFAFWCGIVRVYVTSAQLGIRWRVLGLLFGGIPFVQVWILYKIICVARKEAAFETMRRQREAARADKQVCATRYPLLLVHGVFFRDSKVFNYWGRIPDTLKANGAVVHYGNHQSAASVAVGAEELAARIRSIVQETGCEKVNVIAHSKGGLEMRYALAHLDIAPMVASVTTINTPHRGCLFAEYLLKKAPETFKKTVAQRYNQVSAFFGDHEPNFMAAVEDLTAKACISFDTATPVPDGVFCQSIGSKLNRASGGRFPMNWSGRFAALFDGPNDGLVGENSFAWGERFAMLTVRGKRGISHGDMIDLNRENLPEFDVREWYVDLVHDLKERDL